MKPPEIGGSPHGEGSPDELTGTTQATRGESSPTGEHDVEFALATARRWENTARTLVNDDELTTKQKCAGLIDMAFRARRSPIAGLLEAAIWRGSKHFFQDVWKGGRAA